MPKKYPEEFRKRAVRLVQAGESEGRSRWEMIESVSSKLGTTPETIRRWVNQAEVDAGLKPGVSSEESEKVRQLQKENRELKRANEILKAASAFFAAELDRP